MKLRARVANRWDAEPFVVRLSTNASLARPAREREALLIRHEIREAADGFRCYFLSEDATSYMTDGLRPLVELPSDLAYLSEGDIVRLNPRAGQVNVLYRRDSRFNAMLMTERCNSNCLMCSQPPRDIDDSFLVKDYLDAVPLMSRDTVQLGITGGEPTLLGKDLLRIIRACKNYLPSTDLHMLSNGRLFSYLSLCKALAGIGHPNLTVAIPVYSDIAHLHDYVVQAAGAFDETVRGIMNLKRFRQQVEIRVVLHKQTIDRLPQLARFIVRNLPSIDHVALMGLEMMGYTRMNLKALWIDPYDYRDPLSSVVHLLARHGMCVSIYNHQLCVLNRDMWPYARQSISDWKNEYLDECNACSVKPQCGGFFSSAKLRYSDHIRAIPSQVEDVKPVPQGVR